MTRLTRRNALGLLGGTALTACSPAISTSQLGDDPFEGGIGGTGIVGLMTGTGSVLVNGLRVEVTSATRIFHANERTNDTLLVPGRTLTMLARARLGRFEAKRIDIDDPLTGILLRQANGYSVNSTPVRGINDASGRVGERVSVSGIWQADGSVRTSLIRRASASEDSVSGVLEGSASTGWTIGQTPITPPSGQSLIGGQFVVAKGQFTHGTLQAHSLRFGRFREGGETLRQLSVEGYLEPVVQAPGFRLAGLGHSFDNRLQLASFANSRAVYFGPYTGRFVARRAVLVPEAQGQRASLLRPADGQSSAASLSGDRARPIITR
ncbi:hypothetical protein GCM10007385_08720 [Tateyamaria omphalii]|uniref:DUF5666 domain-containing protein n=1 Tax=Tateyamaria omphalii TaxID=299262 RepID=UPI001678134C|nr:DUF5666 domain-containing protein [Tateyamaria omphalii]GGX43103.1 hypothetical protein GCM10007385_08720 [Tateyamaria omphalii]